MKIRIPARRKATATSRCMLLHHRGELRKKVMRIVRARRGFGMILHAEKRQIPVTHAFVRVIVEVDVGDFDVARRQRFGIDTEPVILGGDFHLLVQKILYGMIRAVMAEFQFESLPAKSQTAELMAEA